MQLPHPKKLDIAVPANLKAGQPVDDQLPEQPEWAPVAITYSGTFEVEPEWVAGHLDAVNVLDVRSRAETEHESERIDGALMIPLSELRDRVDEVPKGDPVVTICRSGKRSVLAFNILREAGWDKVANINGGLLRWREESLPFTHG